MLDKEEFIINKLITEGYEQLKNIKKDDKPVLPSYLQVTPEQAANIKAQVEERIQEATTTKFIEKMEQETDEMIEEFGENIKPEERFNITRGVHLNYYHYFTNTETGRKIWAWDEENGQGDKSGYKIFNSGLGRLLYNPETEELQIDDEKEVFDDDDEEKLSKCHSHRR